MVKKFSERLRKLRTDKELSQAKLAVALGTHQQTVDRWERGLIEPSMEVIIQIAVFFDVTTDYLLGLNSDISKIVEMKKTAPR